MKQHEFEALSEKEQLDFIKTQNPTIVRSRSVTKAQKETFGEHYYAYNLDTGWKYLPSRTREECEEKFKAKMA